MGEPEKDPPASNDVMKGEETEANACTDCMVSMDECINGKIQGFFYAVGKSVGESPWWFIGISIFITLSCMAGNVNFHSENEANKLWVPDDTQAQDDYSFVKNNYGSELRFEFMDIQCTDGNCLTKANLDTAYQLVQDVAAIDVTHKGRSLSFDTLCYKRGTSCWKNNILEIFNYNPSNWDTDAKIKAQVNTANLQDTNGYAVNINDVAGGYTKVGGEITGAKAIKLSWFLKNSKVMIPDGEDKNKMDDEYAKYWESFWLAITKGSKIQGVRFPRTYPNFKVDLLSTRSFGDEFGGAIRGDLIMVNISMLALIVYGSIMLGQCRPNKSRVALAFLGVMTVGMAIGASMGICSAFGLFYSPLASVLPFLLLGLGMDDMFVIAINYDITDPTLPIPERMGRCLAHAGSSIMVTSLTDFLAFLIGGTTSLPALRMFCFYAAVGILFILVLQVCLFSAMLVVDERQKQARMNDCCCCCSGCPCASCPCNGIPEEESADHSCIPSEQSAPVYPTTSAEVVVGAIAPADSRECCDTQAENGKGSGSGKAVGDLEGGNPLYQGTNCCGVQVGLLRYFMQHYLGPALTSVVGQGVCLLAFAVIFGIGLWGATQIKEDSDYRDFMPAGSYVIDFIDTDEAFFTTVGVRVGVYTGAASYFNQHAEMQALYDKVKASAMVISTTLVSWEKEFHAFQIASQGGAATTEAAWYTNLNAYLAGAGARFRGDVKFKNNKVAGGAANAIVAARLNVNHRMCTNSRCEVENMKVLRVEVSGVTPKLASTPAAFPFSEQYLNYEQYATIEDEAKRNIGLSFLAIFIITIVMIPHPVVAMLVFGSVAATIIEVVGYMYWWGLKVDGVTVVMLIVAIGLAIDYSAHIGVAYLHSLYRTREEAVIHALVDMGTPVVHGATSTFIAIVVLAPSASYVFQSFFRQLFLATILGCGHGLLVLPVLLSLVGPIPNGKEVADMVAIAEVGPATGVPATEVPLSDINISPAK